MKHHRGRTVFEERAAGAKVTARTLPPQPNPFRIDVRTCREIVERGFDGPLVVGDQEVAVLVERLTLAGRVHEEAGHAAVDERRPGHRHVAAFLGRVRAAGAVHNRSALAWRSCGRDENALQRLPLVRKRNALVRQRTARACHALVEELAHQPIAGLRLRGVAHAQVQDVFTVRVHGRLKIPVARRDPAACLVCTPRRGQSPDRARAATPPRSLRGRSARAC